MCINLRLGGGRKPDSPSRLHPVNSTYQKVLSISRKVNNHDSEHVTTKSCIIQPIPDGTTQPKGREGESKWHGLRLDIVLRPENSEV